MIDSVITKIIKPTEINWDSDKYLSLKLNENDEKLTVCELKKGASDFLHKQLGIKPATSKEVNKINEKIWKELRDFLIQRANENPDMLSSFSFDKDTLMYFINNQNDLIDIYDARTNETYEDIEESMQNFILDITTNDRYDKFFAESSSSGLEKIICYKKGIKPAEENYVPVIIIEYNNNKADYKIYIGIFIQDPFIFIPNISPFMTANCLSSFIMRQDLSKALEYSIESSESLYESYKGFKDNAPEISARELISLLKNVGYKLCLKTDDQLDAIPNLKDEYNNQRVQDFFNTFVMSTGETAYDIIALPDLQKIFRYNKLTMIDILSILSKEYLNEGGSKITADILGTIVFNLHDKRNDKKQIETIKKEIEEN